MAVGKEIKTKIRSIQSTRKITSAMELVAASKMKKVQERMTATRPYSANMIAIIHQIAASSSEYHHSFMDEREVKNVGMIIVSSDRGLCGGLNYALFKKTLLAEKEWEEKGVNTKMAVYGSKGGNFFKGMGRQMEAAQSKLSDHATMDELGGVLKVMLDLYRDKSIDALYLGFNRFVNTMVQAPTLQQLLPLPSYKVEQKGRGGAMLRPPDSDGGHKDGGQKSEQQAEAPSAVGATTDENKYEMPQQILQRKYAWDYLYEPDAKELLDKLLERYCESSLYQAVVENLSCEQAARMIAMKSATDNAGEIIEELQLIYNKARQAVITQEISEIVAGSEAL